VIYTLTEEIWKTILREDIRSYGSLTLESAHVIWAAMQELLPWDKTWSGNARLAVIECGKINVSTYSLRIKHQIVMPSP